MTSILLPQHPSHSFPVPPERNGQENLNPGLQAPQPPVPRVPDAFLAQRLEHPIGALFSVAWRPPAHSSRLTRRTTMADVQHGTKQAACVVCRKSKIKCEWSADQNECRRCAQLDVECVRPTFHAGRQKGIKK